MNAADTLPFTLLKEKVIELIKRSLRTGHPTPSATGIVILTLHIQS
jgi:hypothetical protein